MASGGRVVVTISTRDETKSGLRKVNRGFKDLTKAAAAFQVAAVAAFAAIVFAVVKATQAFADFDTRIREITTLLSDLDEDTIQQLEENVLSLAVSTGQAVEDMAKANYDAISAGFTDASESALLLEQAARLAVGGVSDVAKTTDVLTSILNSYGQSAQSAAKFSDELFTVVRLGKTTIDELASGLGRAVAIAPQLGVSFQDLGAAIATLTAAGQSTDLTITSLTQVLSKFLAPTDALEKRLKELGFTTGRAAIESLGFAETLQRVADGADEVQLAAFFSDVRAIRAVLPLAGVQAEKFAQNVIQMGEAAGAADEAFRKISEGIGFRLDQINTLFQTALIAAGDAFLPVIEAMIGIDGELGNIAARRQEITTFFEDVKAVVQGFVDVMTFLREIAQEPLLITILTKIDPDLETLNEINRFFVAGIGAGIGAVKIPVELEPEIDPFLVPPSIESIKKVFRELEDFAKEEQEKANKRLELLAEKAQNTLTQSLAAKSIIEEPLKAFNLLQNQIDSVTKQLLRLQLQAQTEVALLGIADDKTLENIRQISVLLSVINQQANELQQAALTENISQGFEELEKRANGVKLAIETIPEAIEAVQIKPGDILPPSVAQQLGSNFRSLALNMAFQITDTIADSFIDAFNIADTAFGNLVSSILRQAARLAAKLAAAKILSLIPGVGPFASLIPHLFEKGGIVPNFPKIKGFQAGGIGSTDTIPAFLSPNEAIIPAPSVQNNREVVDRLIASPEPLQSMITPAQQSSSNINISFNGFDEISAQRVLQSPEFQNTFADIINNGDLKVEVEGKQIEVIR